MRSLAGVVLLRGCSQTVCGFLLVLELELLEAGKQVCAVCISKSREPPHPDVGV